MTDRHEDFGNVMTGLSAAAARATEVSLAPFMLSPLEYRVLERCHRGEANTVTELARIFPVDASTMSRMVNKLVDRGLIRRRRLSKDRRTVLLKLTAEGNSVVDRLAECMRASQVALMDGISDEERHAFTATANKIIANLGELGAGASTPARGAGARARVVHRSGPGRHAGA